MAESDQNTGAEDKVETPQSPVKLQGWVKLLFGVSLALNVLVIAAVGSAVLKFGGQGQLDTAQRPAPSPALVLIRALPREDRETLRRAFVRAGEGATDGEPRNPPNGSRRERLLQILQQSPFDADALEAFLKHHARFSHQRAENGATALAGLVAGMTEEQRAEYAQEIVKLFNRAERRRQRR